MIVLWLVLVIVFIVLATAKLKWHPFLVLLLACFVTAFCYQLPLTGKTGIAAVIGTGFGNILGSIGLVITLGTIIGLVLEKTGAALVMAESVVKVIGPRFPTLAMSIVGAIVSVPVFCDSGFVILHSLKESLAKRMKVSSVAMSVALATGLYATHTFVPPTPGPIAAGEYYGANIGHVLLLGLPIAVITWYFSGYLLGQFLGRHFHVPVPDFLSGGKRDTDTPRAPASAGTVIGIMLIPMVLIFLNTGLMTLISQKVVSADATWVKLLRMLGATPIALLIAV